MPNVQVVDLNPEPRTQATNLEKTLSSFANRYVENQRDVGDVDNLSSIYNQYRQGNQKPEDLLFNIQTNKGMSPTSRAKAAQELLEFEKIKKTNEDKDNSDQRLVVNHYEKKIKEIDKKISEARKDKKGVLEQEKERLLQAQQNDLSRFKKPIYSDMNQAQQVNAQPNVIQPTVSQDPVTQSATKESEQIAPESKKEVVESIIDILTETFPPSSVAVGTIKYIPANNSPDGKTHSFKSDGEKWVLIK